MNNLVIGNTSQLAHYFPEDYLKVSSRNIFENIDKLKENAYDRIFLTFAEQRLHEINSLQTYLETNYTLTLNVIKNLKNNANKIIVYGSCELWNNYVGEISLEDPFDYNLNNCYWGYCISKHEMIKEIKKYRNVIVIHPFNFNSPYRKSGFLFYKIFDSIINKKKIEIGDTYFYRDIVHPKYVVERSIQAEKDELVGSGRLIFINDFIRDLYKEFNMNYDYYVKENKENFNVKKPAIYLKSKKVMYTYDDLLNDTINDINNMK